MDHPGHARGPGDVGYLVVIDAATGCPVHLGRDE